MLKTRIIIAILLLSIVSSTATFASGLEDVELPETKELVMPELSTSYGDMLEELKKEGFGQLKHKQGELEAPEVEAPKGAGKSAFETFKVNYGDMWNDESRALKKESIIPDDEFFKAVSDFGKFNQDKLDKEIKKDKEVMSELLKKKLDTKHLYDLDSISSRFKSNAKINTSGFLAGTPKPSGWGTKPSTPSLPRTSLPGASGAGTSGGRYNDSILNTLGKVGTSVSNYVSGVKDARGNHNANIDALKKKKENGGTITQAEKQMLYDGAKAQNQALLKPITTAASNFKSAVNKQNESQAFVNDLKKEDAKKTAEAKHGKGNTIYAGSFFGNEKYVNRDSLAGKALKLLGN